MSGPSAQRLIVRALRDRLRTITKANGYQTDMGQAVITARSIDPDHDPSPAVTIENGDGARMVNDAATHEQLWDWVLNVVAYFKVDDPDGLEPAAADDAEPGDTDEDGTGLPLLSDAAADIIRAIMVTGGRVDLTLGELATDVAPVAINHLLPDIGGDIMATVVTFRISWSLELFHVEL